MGWGAGQRDRPKKSWIEVVDKEMANLHLKPSDAVDCKWKEMISGNWCDRTDSSSDDIGRVWIVFLVPADLD